MIDHGVFDEKMVPGRHEIDVGVVGNLKVTVHAEETSQGALYGVVGCYYVEGEWETSRRKYYE